MALESARVLIFTIAATTLEFTQMSCRESCNFLEREAPRVGALVMCSEGDRGGAQNVICFVSTQPSLKESCSTIMRPLNTFFLLLTSLD
eukprot:1145447-Pelagomonas_calceolata.AAC.11